MRDNKVLLVTGASSDVGRALIGKISDNYSYILAHYNRSYEQIEFLMDELGDKIIPVQADFGDSKSISNMIAKIDAMHKYPDHIIHLSAPKFSIQKFVNEDINRFRYEYATVVESIMQILIAFLPNMAKQKFGKVIFMLTTNVINYPAKYQSKYTTAKYALYGLMKSLSVEYADKGITFNAVSPGMMETKFLDEIPDIIIQKNAESSPFKRNLSVAEIIPAFIYLLSEGANMVTGINIPVTGGNI